MEASITTKYHAEYAGEGIEYSWGASKAVYRRYPLASKKRKENFDKHVSKCFRTPAFESSADEHVAIY